MGATSREKDGGSAAAAALSPRHPRTRRMRVMCRPFGRIIREIGAFVIPRFAAAAAFATLILAASLLAGPAAPQPPGDSSSSTGAALFAAHCSGCHSGDDARAPSAEVLHGRSPQAI